jgi:hypothetical protein
MTSTITNLTTTTTNNTSTSDSTPNRIVYSQTAISKAACGHIDNNNNNNNNNNDSESSNTDKNNTDDNSSCENLTNIKKNTDNLIVNTNNNPWVKRSLHTEIKEVSESVFSKTSTTNESLVGTSYEYSNNKSNNVPQSLPINNNNNLKNSQIINNSGNRVTFDPKLDKI